MIGPLLILVYVVLSSFVALLGRKSAIGFIGWFVLGLLITPFVAALILMMAAPRKNSSKA